MADMTQRRDQHRLRAGDHAVGQRICLTGHGPDPAAIIDQVRFGQCGDAVDVHQHERLAHAQGQQGHERLSAREDSRSAAGFRQQCDSFRHALRHMIIEWCRLHGFSP